MSLGRRDFIKTAAAFGAAGPALAQGASAPNLRVGILSDIHVTARAAAARAPVFPADAEVSVAEIDDGHRRNKAGTKLDPRPRKQVIVSFPSIVTGAASPSRGFEFSVTAEMRVADMTQVLQEKRVFSPNAYMAEEEDVEPVTCAFARADIPKRRDVRFVVRPIDCWGNKGAAIASPWRRFST